MISSTQNARVKLIRLLQSQSKARRSQGRIVLDGRRLVEDALQQGQQPDFVFYTDESLLPSDLPDAEQVTPEVMRHMSDTQQPQGIMAVFPLPDLPLPPSPSRLLVLDAIRDPGNLGTILRTAAAAGVDALLLSPDCVDAYNPKVLRAGMGAHFRIPVQHATWDEIAAYCSNLTVYLADSSAGLAYTDVDWLHPWVLIVGSEAHGAGQPAQTLASTSLRIPMAAETESINAAMAAGVILFEAQRQRRARQT